MKIIEEKIEGIQNELEDLKGEFQAFHQNKSCVAGVHSCDFLRLFVDYAEEMDELIEPLEGFCQNCIDEDGDAIPEKVIEMQPVLLMFTSNALNQFGLKLSAIIKKAEINAEENSEKLEQMFLKLEALHRTLNRIKLYAEFKDDLS